MTSISALDFKTFAGNVPFSASVEYTKKDLIEALLILSYGYHSIIINIVFELKIKVLHVISLLLLQKDY